MKFHNSKVKIFKVEQERFNEDLKDISKHLPTSRNRKKDKKLIKTVNNQKT